MGTVSLSEQYLNTIIREAGFGTRTVQSSLDTVNFGVLWVFVGGGGGGVDACRPPSPRLGSL